MQIPQMGGTGLDSLVSILAPVFIIGGIVVWAWMARPVRVAVRRSLGLWHARRYGVAAPDTPEADESETASSTTASGLDREKSVFDLSMFGPRADEQQ